MRDQQITDRQTIEEQKCAVCLKQQHCVGSIPFRRIVQMKDKIFSAGRNISSVLFEFYLF
jgi:hypothetical protein